MSSECSKGLVTAFEALESSPISKGMLLHSTLNNFRDTLLPLHSTYNLNVTTPTSQASKLRLSKARLAGPVLQNSSRFSSRPRLPGQGEQGWSWSLTCRDRGAWPGGAGAGGTAGGGRDGFVGHPNSGCGGRQPAAPPGLAVRPLSRTLIGKQAARPW